MTPEERIQDRAIDYGDNVQDYRNHPPVMIVVVALLFLIACIYMATTVTLNLIHKYNQKHTNDMTTLELTQATARALDQAINLIISENKIDEALQRLNEARICTEEMERIINPPLPVVIPGKPFIKALCDAFHIPEDKLFTKTRKREICNARQAYMYILMNTYIKGKVTPGPSRMKRHTGWDHATCLFACKAVTNYMETERMFAEIIAELQMRLRDGSIEYPDLNQYVGWK